MALPNGAGGYQFGDGNETEINMVTQVAPTAKVAAATLTAAELATGIITYTGAAVALTVPLGADLDVAFPSMKVNSCFDFFIINTGATNAATVTANTGCTLVGVAAVAAVTAANWRVRKTAAATYVFYRIAG
jgi:spermidine/putrescine-binding protein